MDLNSIEEYIRPSTLSEIGDWGSDRAWLAGGTWLFTEAQPNLKKLIDIADLGWSEVEISEQELTIGAACVLSDLLEVTYPATWTGVDALQAAVRELASFKIHHVATVGGNLCLAIPAGTFAPAMVLLNAMYDLVALDGTTRSLPALNFQTGIKQTVLLPGEVLRQIRIAKVNLEGWRIDYRRICVATAGLAIAIVVSAYHRASKQIKVAIGAAFACPIVLEFNELPSADELTSTLVGQEFLADSLASAEYRQQVTQVLIGRSLAEVVKD
jgi:CO/xanthine dehydrogenase FAD-binding subunit